LTHCTSVQIVVECMQRYFPGQLCKVCWMEMCRRIFKLALCADTFGAVPHLMD